MIPHASQEKMAKLRWQCRRGMLELDVLLQNYLDNYFADASKEEQQVFIDLLNSTDQELYGWFMNYEVPAREDFNNLVTKIRQVHKRS